MSVRRTSGGNVNPSETVRKFVAALAGMAALLMAQLCFAQSFTSSITGTVTDPTGGTVAGAHVELKNMSTNDLRVFTSQNDGAYQFNNLQPGTYQLTVDQPGFKTYVQQNLVLEANINTTVNVALSVGATQQKVEVTGAAVLIDTETANDTVTLDHKMLEQLPNATRNPLNFVFAIAGTTEAPGQQTQRFGTFDQMSSN